MSDEAIVTTAIGAETGESEAPRMLDTYALLFAATLVCLVPSGLVLTTVPMYSYTPLYTSLVALPPLLGMLVVLATDPEKRSIGSLLGRTALLSALALAGSVSLMFAGALLLFPVSTWLVPANFGAFAAVAVGLLLVMTAPLVVVLIRQIRDRSSIRSWVRIALIVAALVGIGVVIYYSFAPGRVLATALRKDQGSFLMGAITWYIPTYALSGAIARKVGLG
jgi:hypothetical protein